MSDAFKKVQTGDKLRIPATAYNAFIDAAQDFRGRTATLGRQAVPTPPQASIILIRNDSGSDVGRFAVLGIDEPVIGPATNLAEFKNRVAQACGTPELPRQFGRFVITMEPIRNGGIGRAWAAGVCPVQVSVDDDDAPNRLADIADGVTGHLKAGLFGAAAILWREGGTGNQWAVVRLGIAPGIRPYALDPCDDPAYHPTRYTTDDLADFVGRVVRVNDEMCYLVRIPDDAELECVEPECGLSIAGPFDNCCECEGVRKLQLSNCDSGTTTIHVRGDMPLVVGDVVRIDDVCYTIDAIEDCEEQTTQDLLPGDVYATCEDCHGQCFDLTPCFDGSPLAVRSPDIADGDIVSIDGVCYQAALRTCDGTETDLTPDATYSDCDDCREQLVCSGECEGLTVATASGGGTTEAEAIDAALAEAQSVCGDRGIKVCACDSWEIAPAPGPGSWTAAVCYDCCCPEGHKRVTTYRYECEGGDLIEIEDESFCVVDDDCPEPPEGCP